MTAGALATHDAVLVVSYGGPDGPDAVLPFLHNATARRVVCVLTSAYASYSSCRQYREDIDRALAATGAPIAVDLIGRG